MTDASGLRATDEIDGLDLAVGTDGDLHLVWHERLGLYGGPRGGERIVYRRAGGTPLRWMPPVVVTEPGVHPPQIAVTREGVHVFSGGRLRHWLLPAGGDAFVDQGELLTSDDPVADEFDAIASGDGIAIVFARTGLNRHQKVHGMRWSATGRTAPVFIADSPAMPAGPAPKLYGLDGRLIAVWAETASANTFDKQTRVTTLNSNARVRAVWSNDGGRTWGKATQVTPAMPSSNVHAVAAAGTAEAPVAFFTSYGLFASRWAAGAWTSPVRIAGYSSGSLAGSEETTAVAATQCAGHTAVVWADARHRRSDRRWWNPLGGFPWGDNPDWHNNDLFVATRVDLQAGPAAAATEVDLQADPAAAATAPVRLTPPGSFTREIAIAPRDGELIVLRAGRTRVRKSPEDAGAPPVILQSQIPCG